MDILVLDLRKIGVDEKSRSDINERYYQDPDFLDFEINDLNYIIVEKRSDIIEAIKVIKSLKLDEMENEILIQKIIDIESIHCQLVQAWTTDVLIDGRILIHQCYF